MKAYLLAAGKAERMFPYSAITEKCMLPIGGKPIIRIIVEQLLESKIVQPSEIIISTLPVHADIIKHEFRDIPLNVVTIDESPNTASHYYYVSKRDRVHPEEDVLVHYTDNLSAINYQKFAEEYYRATTSNNVIKCAIAGTILIKHDYSAIRFKSKMRQYLDWNELMHAGEASTKFFDIVTEFEEKPYLGDRGWMGMAMFKNGPVMEAIESVEKETVDFGFDVFPVMIKKGQVILHKHEGEWFDVGNVTSYMKLRKRIATGEKIV